jgi:hypothetical protein
MYTLFVPVGNGVVKPAMMYTKPLKEATAGPDSGAGRFIPLLQVLAMVS